MTDQDERLLRMAAVHGEEFVAQVLQLQATINDVIRRIAQAVHMDPEAFALAPTPIPDDAPHALPPP